MYEYPTLAIPYTPYPLDVVNFSMQEQDTIPRLMTVIDVQGIGMSSITTDVLSFIQKSGEVIDNYYPEQVKRYVNVDYRMRYSAYVV
ncbi:hypothetical protein EON63_24975 [archaeon]|nr:MAG: hypothetical protein EON63_24975 [archaeon]